jgi:membrane fusion protein, heavy metal efflux system
VRTILLLTAAVLAFLAASCRSELPPTDPNAEAPPPATVEHVATDGELKVDRPEQFKLVTATARTVSPELNVTGVVSPDVSRNVPVVSLASGRVVELLARLGDTVKKGQLLMRIQSADISAAFSDYRKAMASESLAQTQLDRAKLLFDKGAIAQKDLELAQDASVKAAVDVETAKDHLRVLGADVEKPSALVNIYAPVSGVITEQNVTAAAGVKTLDNSPNLFTISDMSEVWIICDVYENDLSRVRVGETAEVRLNAYPDRTFRARIDNIGPILDPNVHTAKVRLQMPNPGMMRIGMFVTASFRSADAQVRATVPASAVLHLHDRDWVYVPAGNGRFKRLPVTGGAMLPGNLQEIVAGLESGQQVVADALVLQSTVEQ